MDNIETTAKADTSSGLIGRDGKEISCAVPLTPLELNQVKIIGRHTPVTPPRLHPPTKRAKNTPSGKK